MRWEAEQWLGEVFDERGPVADGGCEQSAPRACVVRSEMALELRCGELERVLEEDGGSPCGITVDWMRDSGVRLNPAEAVLFERQAFEER